MEKQQLLQEVEKLCREVGQWMVDQRVESSEIESKSLNNFVSFVDKGSEEKLVAGLSQLLPGSGFIAEEGTGEEVEDGPNWIIDPLDGTTNFLHHVPMWCISIALHEKDQLTLGIIYDPLRKESYTAIKGEGAFLNGKPIRASNGATLRDSLLATGFPYDDFGRQTNYMKLLADLTTNTRGIRRLGSAALDLAYVAAGRFEAFYEYSLNPWDVAAGILIVEEAGGKVTGFKLEDDPLYGDDILASNSLIHNKMLEVIEKHKV